MHEHSNRSAPVKRTVIGLNSDDHNNPTRGPYPPTIVYHDGEKYVFSIQDPIYGNMEFLPELPTCSSITILDIEFSQLLYRLLFTCNAVSRLSKIHQAGAAWLWNVSTWNVTRLEHSIGVMLLIRKLKPLDLEQQLAGLLHDISHTAFSHVIDYMLLNDTDDFHEGIIHDIVNAPNSKFCHHAHHENSIDYEYLSNSSIINTEFSSCSNQESLMDILREFKMEHVMDKLMDLKTNHYTLLEMEFPQLCADRIDYTLRDQFCYNFHLQVVKSNEEFFKIVQALRVVSFNPSKKEQQEENDILHEQATCIISFDDTHVQEAEHFMELYKQEVVDFFLGLENLFANDALAHLLRLCVQEKIISVEDMIWGDDDRILYLVKRAVTHFEHESNNTNIDTILELFKTFETRKAQVLSNKKDDISNYVHVLSDDSTGAADYSPIRKKRYLDFTILKNMEFIPISQCSEKAKHLFEVMNSQNSNPIKLKRVNGV